MVLLGIWSDFASIVHTFYSKSERAIFFIKRFEESFGSKFKKLY